MYNKIELIEKSEGLRAYDCDGVYYIELDKGAIASDHIHNDQEIIYLVKGKAEYTIGNKRQVIKAPTKIIIPPQTYHKFTALTDCVGIEMKTKKL